MTPFKEEKLNITTIRAAYDAGKWRKFAKNGQFRNLAFYAVTDEALAGLRLCLAYPDRQDTEYWEVLERNMWQWLTS